MFWKWFGFILICADTVGYIVEQANKLDGIARLIGLSAGIALRVYALYGAATCWLLA